MVNFTSLRSLCHSGHRPRYPFLLHTLDNPSDDRLASSFWLAYLNFPSATITAWGHHTELPVLQVSGNRQNQSMLVLPSWPYLPGPTFLAWSLLLYKGLYLETWWKAQQKSCKENLVRNPGFHRSLFTAATIKRHGILETRTSLWLRSLLSSTSELPEVDYPLHT